jgi:toxin FitB
MSWLLDTNIIVDQMKEIAPPSLSDWLEREEMNCFVSVITIAELERGVYKTKGTTRNRQRETLQQLIEALDDRLLNFTRSTAKVWGEFYVRAEQSEKKLALANSYIAAIAIEHELTIVSNDRDFGNRGLKWFDPKKELS